MVEDITYLCLCEGQPAVAKGYWVGGLVERVVIWRGEEREGGEGEREREERGGRGGRGRKANVSNYI